MSDMVNLQQLGQARVLVVGDVMLDRYWFSEVTRISPEAPVPVAKVNQTEDRPGGAANVARNAASLGARVTLLSVTGQDEPAQSLAQALQNSGVRTHFHADPSIRTTVKLRVLAMHQQLLRIDFEESPDHSVLDAKLAEYQQLLAETDVVVLSDYGKGTLLHVQPMIALARAAGKPVLVDPKGDEYQRYAGASLLTPNRSEFRQVAGRWGSEAELTAKAERWRHDLQLEGLLVTRSEEGMSLFLAQGHRHEPARAREVYDVSGAGDTVIATLAVLRAAGADWAQAIHYANLAAGIVVGKLGTAVVLPEELQAAVAAQAQPS